jgi:hypothetical protein
MGEVVKQHLKLCHENAKYPQHWSRKIKEKFYNFRFITRWGSWVKQNDENEWMNLCGNCSLIILISLDILKRVLSSAWIVSRFVSCVKLADEEEDTFAWNQWKFDWLFDDCRETIVFFELEWSCVWMKLQVCTLKRLGSYKLPGWSHKLPGWSYEQPGWSYKLPGW